MMPPTDQDRRRLLIGIMVNEVLPSLTTGDMEKIIAVIGTEATGRSVEQLLAPLRRMDSPPLRIAARH